MGSPYLSPNHIARWRENLKALLRGGREAGRSIASVIWRRPRDSQEEVAPRAGPEETGAAPEREELPARREREEILRLGTQQASLAPDVDLSHLATITTGFTRDNLEQLAESAVRSAARDSRDTVTLSDFEEALDTLLSDGAQSWLPDPFDRWLGCYRVAARVVISWQKPADFPVSEVTILPPAHAVQEPPPSANLASATHERALAHLDVALAGPAALEETLPHALTDDLREDIDFALRVARHIVKERGLEDVEVVGADDSLPHAITAALHASRGDAGEDDQAVQRLLATRYRRVCTMLVEEEVLLSLLAQRLMEDERIDREELRRLLGPRSG